jgi:spermidine synthase
MVDIVSPGESKGCVIEHVEVTREASMFTAIRNEYVSPGMYAHLRVRGQLMMSDTHHEKMTNYEIVHRAYGRVLIAGLGIGMILVPILQKDEVTHVTVLEKEQGVIDLVGPKFQNPKLEIIHADVFDWQPPKDQKWNVIYFDIWGHTSSDDLKEMAQLKRKYAKRLDRSDGREYMACWVEKELKARKRKEDKEAKRFNFFRRF